MAFSQRLVEGFAEIKQAAEERVARRRARTDGGQAKSKQRPQRRERAAELGRSSAKRAAQLAQAAGRTGSKLATDPEIEATVGRDERYKSKSERIAERAERAAQARAPVDADLSPVGNPRAMEAFAAAGFGDKDPGYGLLQPDSPDANPGGSVRETDTVAMVSPMLGSGDGSDGSALEFDDEFGLTGGDE